MPRPPSGHQASCTHSHDCGPAQPESAPGASQQFQAQQGGEGRSQSPRVQGPLSLCTGHLISSP